MAEPEDPRITDTELPEIALLDARPLHPWLDRLFALVVLGTGLFIVVVLALVPPDPRGYGTHELLGMEPCSWPASGDGLPCPTCGVTTAACHLVHLQPIKAVTTHPFGAFLAGAGIWLMVLAAISLVRRRSFVEKLARLPYGTLLTWALVLLVGSWLYKYLIFT